MSHADAAAAPDRPRSRPPSSRPKATLFCPDCGREAALGGDWVLRPAGDSLAVVCPDCSAVVASRAA